MPMLNGFCLISGMIGVENVEPMTVTVTGCMDHPPHPIAPEPPDPAYGLSVAARSVIAKGFASVATTVTDATFDAADEWPVVSRVMTVKLCTPTARTSVVNVPAAPVTLPIGVAGVADAVSKISAPAIMSGVNAVLSVRVTGGVHVRVAVAISSSSFCE